MANEKDRQAMKKCSGKTVLKNYLIGAALWIAKVSGVILACVVLSLIVSCIFSETRYSEIYLGEKVLTIGLSIIGLAIAVWAGLNIVNTIERKDLEELRSRTDSVKKLIYNMENMETIAYDSFLQAMLNVGRVETTLSGADEATLYFYREFSKHNIDCSEDYFTLAKIEDLFGQVYSLHNAIDHFDPELIQKAKAAITHIDEFQTKDQLIKTYLSFRKAEFKYYCGYVGDDPYEKYQFFSEAIESYLEVAPKMGIRLPRYRNYRNKEPLPDCPGTENKKLYIYMVNTIGDACSKIIEKYKKLTQVNASNDTQIIERLKEYGEMALFYCGCATKWADDYSDKEIRDNELQYFEIYYRNCGAAFERYAAAFKSDIDYSETILKNYQKAFYHIVNGTKIRAQRVQSVYHVLLSYLKKYFERELSFKGNNGPLEAFDSKDMFNAACQYQYAIEDKQIKYLKLMVNVSELAIINMPLNNIPHVMNGFAYSYILLLKMAKNSEVCAAFPEDNSVYYDKIQKALSSLQTLKIGDDYTMKLKTVLDILKEKG